jgi:hypothetical protein
LTKVNGESEFGDPLGPSCPSPSPQGAEHRQVQCGVDQERWVLSEGNITAAMPEKVSLERRIKKAPAATRLATNSHRFQSPFLVIQLIDKLYLKQAQAGCKLSWKSD